MRRRAALKLLALAFILTGSYVLARQTGLTRYADIETAAVAVRELRGEPWILPAFVLTYVVAATLGFPGSVLTLAGGAMFGFTLGTVVNWLGATAGAMAAYLLARTLGRDAFAGLLGKHAISLGHLAAEHGFATVLRLRLIPIVPFNALNFASGVAGVDARSYAAATALGILPATAIYTYFADALLEGASGARQGAFVRLAIAGGLLVLLSFVPTIARRLG
ncbi:MAG: VTT domain-containing protein [Gemmatimonadota bacterium]|nr:VTT domain-containing protein [Gemmatimonadota bacterium]